MNPAVSQNVALVLQLAIVAMQHAQELNQLLLNAQAEGRDVTDAEVAAVRSRATSSVDALEKAAAGTAVDA